MLNWLKKHFIPHEGNNHRPHIFNKKNTRNFIVLIFFVEAFVFLIPILSHINMKGGMATVLPAVLADLTNEERSADNLQELSINEVLNQAAELKAEDMVSKGYFAHTSPEGLTPWYWLEKVGYKYQYAGENLAINFSDSKDVTEAWMNSPTHRANIIKDKYTEVGTGVAKGIYEGKETIFIAQVYANPLPKNSIPDEKTNNKNIKEKIITGEDGSSILGSEISPEINEVKENNIIEDKSIVDKKVIDDPIVKLESIENSNVLQKVVASPRNTTNIIIYSIFGLIAVSLLIYLIIKKKNHHIDIITNALIILSILGVFFLANYFITHKNMTTTTSLDYSYGTK